MKPIYKQAPDHEIVKIFYAMCEIWGKSLGEVFAHSKKKDVTTMREICWIAAKVNFNASDKTIAELSDRDRTTVLVGINKGYAFYNNNDAYFMLYYNQVKHLFNV